MTELSSSTGRRDGEPTNPVGPRRSFANRRGEVPSDPPDAARGPAGMTIIMGANAGDVPTGPGRVGPSPGRTAAPLIHEPHQSNPDVE